MKQDRMNQHSRVLLLMGLFFWSVLAFSKISVQIDPPRIHLGETFRLTFSMDTMPDSSIPNLTPLQKDFTIQATERSTAYSIVNGQTQSLFQWTLVLSANKTGVLTIPAIAFGHQQSPVSHIEVANAQDSSTSLQQNGINQDEVMIKTEVTPKKTYVNQQVIYTVKLYTNQRLLNASYQPPTVEDALLVTIGDGTRYETTLNGSRYAVEEQRYAIFPQKHGTLKITPPSFKALVFDTVPRRVSVEAKPVTVSVMEKPTSFKGHHWLPAKQVALTEVYEKTSSIFKEGSTLSRTVTLQASGVPAQLLPSIDFQSSNGFGVYPEKPDMNNSVNHEDVIGRVDVRATYLLNKAGKITIPAIHMTWFNTDTGKEEVVSLPARKIEVVADGMVAKTHQDTSKPQIETKKAPVSTPPTLLAPTKSDRLPWWCAGVLLVLWVITLFLWLRKTTWMKGARARHDLQALQEACAQHAPKLAEEALLKWAQKRWPGSSVLNMHQLAKLVHDASLKKQLFLLSQALYSQEKTLAWNGEELWRCMKAYLRIKPTPKSKRSDLPPIHPI